MAMATSKDERATANSTQDRSDLNTSSETEATAPLSDTKSPRSQSRLDTVMGGVEIMGFGGGMSFPDPPRPHEQVPSKSEFAMFTRRWTFLFSFGILSFCSSWMWMSFSPLATAVSHTWDVSTRDVNDLAGIYLLIRFSSLAISHNLVVNHCGLYYGLLCGAVLNTLGACIRYSRAGDYSQVYVGTVIAAIAHAIFHGSLPLLTESWFPESQRRTVMSLGELTNQLGIAVALGATIFADFTIPGFGIYPYIHIDDVNSSSESVDLNKLQHYMAAQLVMSSLGMIMVALVGGDKPNRDEHRGAPGHPEEASSDRLAAIIESYKDDSSLFCESTGDESSLLLGDAFILRYYSCEEGTSDELSRQSSGRSTVEYGVLESTRIFFSQWTNVGFLFAYSLPVGAYLAFPTFISQLLTFDRYGTFSNVSWSPGAIGWVGLIFQVSGIIGYFVSKTLLERRQGSFYVLRGILGGAAMSLLLFLLASTSTATKAQMESFLYYGEYTASVSGATVLGVMGLGLCLASANAVGVDIASSIASPAKKTTVLHILDSFASVWGYLQIKAGSWMMKNLDFVYGDGRISFLGSLSTVLAIALFLTTLLDALLRPRTR